MAHGVYVSRGVSRLPWQAPAAGEPGRARQEFFDCRFIVLMRPKTALRAFYVSGKAMVGAVEHIYDTEFKDRAQMLARAGFLELNALSRFTVQPSQDGS